MNRLSLAFLLVIVFRPGGSFAQNWAGPDTTICQGVGAMLGLESAPDEYCFHWTPEAGLSSPFEKRPIAKPSQTQEYTLVAIGPDFSNKVVDKVKVIVATGGVVLTPTYTEPDGSQNQSQASLTSKPAGASIIWSIEGEDHHGCTINPSTGKISGCNEFGDVKIRAKISGNEDCFADGTFRVNAGVKEVYAIDNQHPKRKATNNDTLHILGHNDVKIKAIKNDGEEFGEDQPDWTGSTVLPPDPHAVEWVNEDSSPAVYLFQAGQKKVYVQRHQPVQVGAGSLFHSLNTIFTALGYWLKPPETISMGFKYSETQTSACKPYDAKFKHSINFEYTTVEKKDSPDIGKNWTIEGEAGAEATGKICFPPPYSSVPNPLFMWSTYLSMTGGATINISASKDESKKVPAEWVPNDVTATSSLKVGIGGEVGLFIPGDIFLAQGSLFGGIAAQAVIGANSDSVSLSLKFEPLIIEASLKVWYLNPNNTVVELKGKYNVMDPLSMPPRKVFEWPTN